jgi:ClpP class serine protease
MKIFEVTNSTVSEYVNKLAKYENGNGNGYDLSLYFNQRGEKKLENGVGHVYIQGMLLSDATPLDKMTGATDYDDVYDDIEDLLEMGAKVIVLHINSGGGMVTGCIELCEYIESLPVPTISCVKGMAASAAYKIASATSHIISSKSSDVGNIGTIMVFTDTSALTRAMGVQYVTFVNDGAIYKSIGHTDSLTEEQVAYLQTSINKAGSEFQEFVKRNRTVSPEVFTAAWYNGQDAVSVGLIDEIGDYRLAEQRAFEMIDAVEMPEDMEYKPMDPDEEPEELVITE